MLNKLYQCYLNNIFGLFGGANLVVITADAVHSGRGGGGVADKGWGGGRGHRENCFMAFNYCKT